MCVCVCARVKRPADPFTSLPCTHTVVTQLPVWPTAPTSPLPLAGWDGGGGSGKERGGWEGSLPSVAAQMWPVCCLRARRMCFGVKVWMFYKNKMANGVGVAFLYPVAT